MWPVFVSKLRNGEQVKSLWHGITSAMHQAVWGIFCSTQHDRIRFGTVQAEKNISVPSREMDQQHSQMVRAR
ncbi:MAG: hypothetical protein CMM01_26790 [Rhodopirellula sp.]|nr:hypothetical protein [Rhodopirellula sp.]